MDRVTVEKFTEPVTKTFVGLVQAGVVEPWFAARVGNCAPVATPPMVTEAYVVFPRMPLGLVQGLPSVDSFSAIPPRLGPTKTPESDVAIPVSPENGPKGKPTIVTTNVVNVDEITNTVVPFKNVKSPVNPLSKNSSFTIGCIPVYVKVAMPDDPKTNPVMSKVVAKVYVDFSPGRVKTAPTTKSTSKHRGLAPSGRSWGGARVTRPPQVSRLALAKVARL